MNPPIVDTHVHFWHPDVLQYDWLASIPDINRPFLPATLAEAAGEDLQKIVFVQADCRPEQGLREVAWVTSLARSEPRIQAIVAFAPLELGAADRDYMQALVEYPLVKGVRRLIQSEAAGFATRPDFVAGVQLLAEFGYSFDICLVHPQLADVLQLVAQCPQVNFVLDHIGKPGIKDRLLEPWREQTKALAAFPNVWCKISGLVTEAGWQSWTREDLKPYIDHIIEVFGSDRVMYGSDWPVSTLATSYTGWLDTLAWAVAGLDGEARHKLFYQNGATFYRLE